MWWELAHNPRVVLAYYTHPPQLIGVEIHSVMLHRDGPTLELVVELPRFPDRPSPRWTVGANMAFARLRFCSSLKQVVLSGWSTTNVGDLLIEKWGDGVRFRFDSGTAQLSAMAMFFDVTGISACIDENSESDTSVHAGA